jgi:hypothetical protein
VEGILLLVARPLSRPLPDSNLHPLTRRASGFRHNDLHSTSLRKCLFCSTPTRAASLARDRIGH